MNSFRWSLGIIGIFSCFLTVVVLMLSGALVEPAIWNLMVSIPIVVAGLVMNILLGVIGIYFAISAPNHLSSARRRFVRTYLVLQFLVWLVLDFLGSFAVAVGPTIDVAIVIIGLLLTWYAYRAASIIVAPAQSPVLA